MLHRAAEYQPSEGLLCMMRGGDNACLARALLRVFIGFELRNRSPARSGARLYGGDAFSTSAERTNATGVPDRRGR